MDGGTMKSLFPTDRQILQTSVAHFAAFEPEDNFVER